MLEIKEQRGAETYIHQDSRQTETKKLPSLNNSKTIELSRDDAFELEVGPKCSG
jgi:hypothetical protein